MKYRRLIKTAIWILGTDALGFVLTWWFTGDPVGSLKATIVIGVLICALYYGYEMLWEWIDKQTVKKAERYGTSFIPGEEWEALTKKVMQKHSHALDMLKDK